MTQSNPNASVTDCILATITGFLLPFFLDGAGGDKMIATAAIREMLDAYNARTPAELDLAGRIVGFSIVALDNLRLSMTPDLPDAKALRYRTNAVTLTRASDNARKMMTAIQAKREVKRDVPRPSIAVAPPAQKPVAPKPSSSGISEAPMDLETMKRDARIMMQAFSKGGIQSVASLPMPDTAAMVKAATQTAVGTAIRASTA